MPFESEAQRRKFYAMADRGEISKETVKEWERETGDKKLPERKKKDKEEKEAMVKVAYDLGFALGFEKEAGGFGIKGLTLRAKARAKARTGMDAPIAEGSFARRSQFAPGKGPKTVQGVTMTPDQYQSYSMLATDPRYASSRIPFVNRMRLWLAQRNYRNYVRRMQGVQSQWARQHLTAADVAAGKRPPQIMSRPDFQQAG